MIITKTSFMKSEWAGIPNLEEVKSKNTLKIKQTKFTIWWLESKMKVMSSTYSYIFNTTVKNSLSIVWNGILNSAPIS